jgi:hypothetical protein
MHPGFGIICEARRARARSGAAGRTKPASARSRERYLNGLSPGFVALKIIALFGSVTFAACGLAAAQGISGEPPFIKHALYLSIESDNPELQNGGPAKATLTVTVRLSDHSRETNFFGDVPATITDFDPVKGSPEQEVWQDASCHHERGYPKMTVIATNGLIAQGPEKQTVEAEFRRRGLPVPQDEVMMAQPLKFGADGHGSFVGTLTATKLSRLSIYLKMFILPCDLQQLRNGGRALDGEELRVDHIDIAPTILDAPPARQGTPSLSSGPN